MRKVIVPILLWLPILAHAADCKDRLTAWTQTLHPGRQLNTEMAVCKVSPADPSQTFAVLPMAQPGATDDEAVYDVDVLVANSDTGAIVAHLFEPAAITSDAVGLRGITLDTARYQLAPQTRAFGVRVDYEGASRVDPMSDTTLDLYVVDDKADDKPDGKALRRVVADLTVNAQNGEWDGDCTGTFSDISRTLSFGPTTRNGYATLHVAEKKVDSANKPTASECAQRKFPAVRKSYGLEYDGAKYVVPAALKYE